MIRKLLFLAVLLTLLSPSISAENEVFNDYQEITSQDVYVGEEITQNCMTFDPAFSSSQIIPCTSCNATVSLFDTSQNFLDRAIMTSRGGGQYYYTLDSAKKLKLPFVYSAVFTCTDTDGTEGNISGKVRVLDAATKPEEGVTSSDTQIAQTAKTVGYDFTIFDTNFDFGEWYDNIVKDIFGGGTPSEEDGGTISVILSGIYAFGLVALQFLDTVPDLLGVITSFMTDPINMIVLAFWWLRDLIAAFIAANFVFVLIFEFFIVGLMLQDICQKRLNFLKIVELYVLKHVLIILQILEYAALAFDLLLKSVGILLRAGTAILKAIPGLG